MVSSAKEAVDMGNGYARLCRFVCHPWWWLRSPNYNNSNNAREVNNNGNANNNNNNVNNTNNGVVPDLLLSKEKRSVGEGTYFRLYDGTL